METKVLIIAVIKKDNAILLRKKPDGSPPYKETWYLFGAELNHSTLPEDTIVEYIKGQIGISIRVIEKFSWDTEVKKDIDDVEKVFVYLDVLCEYIEGELLSQGIEKLEWVPLERLHEYDHVPPSRVVLKKLGYL